MSYNIITRRDVMYEDFIAERLASLRMQKNVSAREMSLSIGQNSSYINRIENKQTMPSMQCFFYICEYLGVTPAEFFDTNNSHPAALCEVIELMKPLTDTQLRLLKDLAKEFSHP